MAKRKRKTRRPAAASAKAPARAKSARPRHLLLALAAMVAGVLIASALLWVRSPSVLPRVFARGSAAGFNVLLITLDTTRADRLGCYGYPRAETPALDALAAEGIRFDDAVSPVPITLPAHATILTGLDPPNHGARNNGEYHLAADHVTLAELLRTNGYETAAFISAFVLDARFGLAQGFDLYDGRLDMSLDAAFAKDLNERSAGRVTSSAIDWLERRDDGRPFFAWVHYFDPHNPYLPPPPFDARFRDQPYDGEIAYMDREIGRLVQALDAQGLRERTLIIAVGDHGEGLGEHGEETHSVLIYESVMRVPLILACPGLYRGPLVVDDAVVSVADVFPTVLELLGIESAEPIDGRSLLRIGADPDRMIYLESLAPYLDSGWSPLYGLRRHHDKYILAPRPEYYDLRSDPSERDNLHDKVSGGRVAARDLLRGELMSRLEKWPSLEGVVAAAEPLDPEARRRLESLGYLGSLSTDVSEEELPDPKDMMPVRRAIDRANGLARTGQLEQAIALLNEAAQSSPRDRRLLLTLGKICLVADRVDEAEQAFRTSLAVKPSSVTCLLLAQIMIRDGRHAEAMELLDRGLALDPRDGGIFIVKGDLLAGAGRMGEALAAYRRAIEIDPYRTTAAGRARIAALQKERGVVSEP